MPVWLGRTLRVTLKLPHGVLPVVFLVSVGPPAFRSLTGSSHVVYGWSTTFLMITLSSLGEILRGAPDRVQLMVILYFFFSNSDLFICWGNGFFHDITANISIVYRENIRSSGGFCVSVCNQLLSSSGPESRGCAPQLVPPEGDDCQISDPATTALAMLPTLERRVWHHWHGLNSRLQALHVEVMMSCLGGAIQETQKAFWDCRTSGSCQVMTSKQTAPMKSAERDQKRKQVQRSNSSENSSNSKMNFGKTGGGGNERCCPTELPTTPGHSGPPSMACLTHEKTTTNLCSSWQGSQI